LENVVKTPYGVWKCPGCGHDVDPPSSNDEFQIAKRTVNENPVVTIFPKNPLETVHKRGKKPYQKFSVILKNNRKKKDIDNSPPKIVNLKKNNSVKSTFHQVSPDRLKNDKVLTKHLLAAVEVSADVSGWANLAAVGIEIRKYQANFDVSSYGCKKFSELIQKIDLFEIREQQMDNSPCKFIFVKRR
jgi:hypothetical protein